VTAARAAHTQVGDVSSPADMLAAMDGGVEAVVHLGGSPGLHGGEDPAYAHSPPDAGDWEVRLSALSPQPAASALPPQPSAASALRPQPCLVAGCSQTILRSNIVGTKNVLDAAVAKGVGRVRRKERAPYVRVM
jgi:hypothetical protein